MAIDFDVYLIDEIIAVGDEDFRKKSRAVFQEKLNKSQIIIISHSPGTIKEFCDCVLLLEGNQIRYFEDIEDLIDAYKILNSNN